MVDKREELFIKLQEHTQNLTLLMKRVIEIKQRIEELKADKTATFEKIRYARHQQGKALAKIANVKDYGEVTKDFDKEVLK